MKIRRSGMRWRCPAMALSYSSWPGLTRIRRGLLRPLGGLAEFLQHAVAFQLGEVVDEQHAVEVIDLVLDAGGIKALGVLFMHLAVEIGETHAHPRGALDLLVIFGDRQAAFL